MIDHLSPQWIERFLARQLDTPELQAVAQHLAVCESCRAAIHQGRATDAAIDFLRADLQQESPAPTHLEYDQLAAYVDASLNAAEREIVRQHLEACAECDGETRELFRLKDNLEIYPNIHRESSASATSAPSTAHFTSTAADAVVSSADAAPATPSPAPRVTKTAPTFWQNRFAFFRRQPLALAMTVVLLAIFVAGFFILRSNNPQSNISAGNHSTSPPIQSANQSATPPQEKTHEAIAPDHPATSAVHPPTDKSKSPNTAHRVKAETPNQSQPNSVASRRSTSLAGVSEKFIQQALASQAIALPEEVRQLIGRRSTLMSNHVAGESFALLTPVGTVIQNDRPTFRWQAVGGATAYTVFVLDSNFHVVIKSEPLTGTSWTAPQALKRGTVYAWQVTANQNGKAITSRAAPLPEARFKILDAARQEELQRLTKARGTSHLVLAIIYAQRGLLDEAESELQTAIEQHQDAEIAKKILQSVKSLRQ